MTEEPATNPQLLKELRGLRRRVAQLEAEAERALRASEWNYREIFEAVNDLIVVHDAETGSVLDANRRVAETLGYTMEEARQLRFEDMFSEEPPYNVENGLRVVRKAASEGPQLFEWQCRRKNGEVFWIEVILKPAMIGGVKRVLAVGRDITARREAAETLRRAHTDLERQVEQRTAELAAANKQLKATIREQQRSEAILRQTNAELQAIYDGTADGILIADAQTRRLIRANARICQFLGYSEQELLGMVADDIHPPGTEEAIVEGFRELQRRPLLPVTEIPCLCKDGRVRYAEISASHVIYGGRSCIVGLFHDVTERKRVAAELQKSEERFRSVFESTTDCILVWDKHYNYLYANQAAIDHVGTTRDKVIGKNMRDGLGHIPDFMRLWMGRVDEVFATGQPMRVEDAVPVGDRLVYSESILSPIRDEVGRLFAVGVVYRDVTDRKMAEKALKGSERRYRHLYDSMMDCYAAIDLEGRITAFNESFVNLIGYAPEEITRLTYRDITPEKWHASEAEILETQVMSRGYSDVYEKEYLRKDGTIVPVELRTVLMRDESDAPEGMWAIIRDITERKQAAAKLAADQQFLRELLLLGERERKLIAHEIHDGFVQDVVGAQMIVDAVRAKPASADDSTWEQLAEVGRLLRNGIVEARRMIGELRPLIIDEHGIVEAINYLVAEERDQGQITYHFDHHVSFDRLDPILEGTVFRVMQEALTNVKRHSRAEQVEIRLTQQRERLRLEIRDDGVGFEPDRLPSERFGVRGICERARLFGGCAEVVSSPGQGTTVAVEFPVVEAAGTLSPDSPGDEREEA